MKQESLEDIIERFQRDRQTIKERMDERNSKFEKANLDYQTNLKRELDTIKLANQQADNRDQELRQYIIQLFKTYDEGNQQMKFNIQKTIQEKINYNDYLIKHYPFENLKEKKELCEENIILRRQIEEQFSQVNNLAQQSIPLIESKQQDLVDQQPLEKYLGEHMETVSQNNQPNKNSNITTRQQFNTKPKFIEQIQTVQEKQINPIQKKIEKDYLSEFLVPFGGRI